MLAHFHARTAGTVRLLCPRRAYDQMSEMTSMTSGGTGRVAGKVVIVSGGARGMGAAHTEKLVAEGARVVFTDLREEQGLELAAELGDRARFVRADVTDAADWERAVRVAQDAFGAPGGLINNAGILETGTLESTTVDEYRRSIEVLQLGVFLGMKAVLPSMKANGGGSIVNISSTGGLVGFIDCFSYGAAKWAVRGMTKSAALELAPYGIRVNSIHPGEIETPMISEFVGSDLIPSFDAIPLGRYGRPHEVAALATFLLSDESSYITGSENIIDGGYTAR